MYRKNWKVFFCMAVLIACFSSFAQSAARKASQYSDDDKASNAAKTTDAADKATDVVGEKAAGGANQSSDAVNKASEVVDKAVDAVNKATDVVGEKAAGGANQSSDAVNKASEVVDKAVDAVNKATSAVGEEAVVADPDSLFFQGMIHSREFILENQKTLFKGHDLDKLLQSIRMVLEKNDIKSVQKQFHQLFDKKDSFVYSCPAENATLDENWQAVKEGMVQEADTQNNQKTAVADAKSHDYENHLQEAQERLEKIHEKSNRAESSQSKDDPLLSSKALYKKGYDLILSAKYVEAEKAFCAFQHRYKKDPLNDDVLFWLAESLLRQKRYHEAAQVYLTAWYTDKKKLYTSEVLLKLAMSMVALDQNKEVCADLAKKSTYHNNTLGDVFCKPLNL